jgi:iron uptake system component EfeO
MASIQGTSLFAALIAIGPLSLTGCSTGTTGAADTKQIAVTISDSCTASETEFETGFVKFSVENETATVAEFYLLGADKISVEAEIERIPEAVSLSVSADLAPGTYFGRCQTTSGKNQQFIEFNVTGSTAKGEVDESQRTVVNRYIAWVQTEADALLSKTKLFAEAVQTGNSTEAKRLYPLAREHWERIEPIAESFGDLDPILDAREGDTEPGVAWTGWHALEKQLWIDGLSSDAGSLASQLVENTEALLGRISKLELNLTKMTNGAKALLDEVASTKITGEEKRYSRTDLYDLNANLLGARKVIEFVAPLLNEDGDEAFLQDLTARFDDIDSKLVPLREGSGFVSYDKVPAAKLRQLADAIEGLSEPLSMLTARVVS